MFDGFLTEADEIISLDKPSLKGLAHILRHKETWPAGFEWNYGDCKSCAIELTMLRWSMIPTFIRHARMLIQSVEQIAAMASRKLGIPKNDGRAILLGIDCSSYADITPEHVADAIDEYIAGVSHV